MRTSTIGTAMHILTTGGGVLLLGTLAAQAMAAPALTIRVDGSTRLIPTRVQYRTTQTGIAISGWVAKQRLPVVQTPTVLGLRLR